MAHYAFVAPPHHTLDLGGGREIIHGGEDFEAELSPAQEAELSEAGVQKRPTPQPIVQTQSPAQATTVPVESVANVGTGGAEKTEGKS